ncbi:fimbrial protein [Pantoea alhagi]|uniref:fimbrial protein n=1 Tax=Pantoea alhagi TaxID=1891675 RepID=UPI00202AE2D7|nr:fimbrial protein [Pantoea alhagi]URQ60462.1 fimbrial protein [Pantoea alhagi]
MSLITITPASYKYLRTLLYATLGSGIFIFSSQACLTDCSIDLNFTGVYTDETCEVVINNDSSNEIITLPRISTASLKNNGSEVGSVPFEIMLKNCPASRTVTVFFDSSITAADNKTGNLVNRTGVTYSDNVQIRLRKENSSQVIIDDAASGQDYVISSAAEPISHKFTASYYAKGDAVVTAGKVYAIAGVELVYK